MLGHRGAFVLASCAAPVVPLVALGVRSLHEPMKLFGPTCVPIYLAIWAALSALAYGTGGFFASLLRGSVPQVGRSTHLSAAAGLLLGLDAAIFEHAPLGLAAIALLGPALFRSRRPEDAATRTAMNDALQPGSEANGNSAGNVEGS